MADDAGIVRRPAVPPPVRIRQDVNKLGPTDPIIIFYDRAIAAMKAKGMDDPTGWRYQAAIHDYPRDESSTAARRAGNDPFAADTDVLPADRGTFWRQCRHFSWFFLPWHRIYLHHFERIVMDQVIALGGPSDWALPYWRWDGPEGLGRLPIAFRTASRAALPNLFVAERDPNANLGAVYADLVTEVDSGFRCLQPTVFMGIDAFGGPPVRRHDRLDPVPPALNGAGRMEGTPHGSMHTATGRPPNGFMRNFTGAPLDPIFWLHHCNIDRLWEVWIQRSPTNTNPDDPAWLDASFDFHDAKKGNGNMTPRQVLNTRKAPLSYEYDDTTDPLAGP